MLSKRIIPCLLIKDGGLVKTKNFKHPKYIGDPINAVKIFSEKEADEIIILDIDATKKKEINFNLLSNIFSESFVPITYGGGINTIETAKKIINLGVEKICIQSIFFENKSLIKEMVNCFGGQSIVVSIDVKKNIFGNYKIWNYLTNEFNKKENLDECINYALNLGVGEIIITDVDSEGTLKGTNKNLIKKICNNINVPLIFNGGTKNLEDIRSTLKYNIQALAVGSFFIFYGKHKAVLITYPSSEIKNLINE